MKKRKLANVVGVLSIIWGSICILGGFLMAVLGPIFASGVPVWHQGSGYGINYQSGYYTYQTDGGLVAMWVCVGLIVVAGLGITVLLLGAKLCKRVKDTKTDDKKINSLLIALIVLNFLFGSLWTFIIAIVALCSNEDSAKEAPQGLNATEEGALREFAVVIKRFKQYLTDGIITEEVYRQKVYELVRKLF